MSELEERVRAALSDPGELERLTKMAQQLMGAQPEETAPPASTEEEPARPASTA